MKNLVGVITALGLLAPVSGATTTIPRIILDTDMRGDCDDAGALALLHALADLGECELLGVMASTTGPHVVGTIAAINAYYGRPDLPVGLYSGTGVHGGDDYAPVVGDPAWFPMQITNDTAPESTALYRRLLHEAPDNSVTIVVIGGQPCVYELLRSEADYEGDGSVNKTGAELAAAKVHELVLMAANFADPNHREWNVILDVEAARTVARDWPTRVVYSGFEIGHVIQTGGRLRDADTNPVAMSYKLYRGTEGGQGVIGNRSSWDQTAAYYAVRGLEHEGQPIWSLDGPVAVSFDDEGRTRFEEDPNGRHYYFVQEMSIGETGALIEELMVRPPRASARLVSPAWGQAVAAGGHITLTADITADDLTIEKVVFLVDGVVVAEVETPPYAASWHPDAPGSYKVQAYADCEDMAGGALRGCLRNASNNPPPVAGARYYTKIVPVSVIDDYEPAGDNHSDPDANLALIEHARLSGSVPAGEGRGTPESILYDPVKDDYHVQTDYNEYGVAHQQNLGLVSEDAPFYWQVTWDTPKNVNEISFGGAYTNQPQPFAMWKLQYQREGHWHSLLEGRGGWINTGICRWGGPGGPAIAADAVRIIVYSDGIHPLVSTHLRGRGGSSGNVDDRDTELKACLIRYYQR